MCHFIFTLKKTLRLKIIFPFDLGIPLPRAHTEEVIQNIGKVLSLHLSVIFKKVLILGGVLGLHCCTHAFPSCSAWASHWVASLATVREGMGFTSCGPAARGIFLHRGSNPCALHGQVNS